MDKGMHGALPIEKLDRSNYMSWAYKMHQYLLGHGYWSYVEGANDATLDLTHEDFPAWKQAASRLMYYFTSSVSDHLLNHIRDAKTPKEGCVDKLEKGFCHKHHCPKVTTQTWVEQCLTERHVDGRLHSSDQGDLWLSSLHQHDCRGGWNRAGLPRGLGVEVLHIHKDSLHEGARGRICLHFSTYSRCSL